MAALHAQIGITTALNFPETRVYLDEYQSNKVGSEIAINGRFTIKSARLYVLPTIYWANNRVETPGNITNFAEYGAQLKFNVYLFNLKEDKAQVRIDKPLDFVGRNLYLQLMGGYGIWEQLNGTFRDMERFTDGYVFGGGVGIDIPLSDYLTVTPQFNLRHSKEKYSDDVVWTVSNEDLTPLVLNRPDLITTQLGVQLSYRLCTSN